jgi:hypothetical protein
MNMCVRAPGPHPYHLDTTGIMKAICARYAEPAHDLPLHSRAQYILFA